MRRVVVTGLGAITPLGVGARTSWSRLVAGDSGLTSVAGLEPRERWSGLTSTVAGLVPAAEWRPSDWLSPAEQRRMPRFTQFAVAAADMALGDAGWRPTLPRSLEATGVCLGSGIGNLHDLYETSLVYEQDVRYSTVLSLAVWREGSGQKR
jgi:3-oxoacyl-[acyl-carrier-protein] synthase II